MACVSSFLAFSSSFRPRRFAQAPVNIGDQIGKLKFTDIRGFAHSLDDFGKKKAYVLVFTNTSCPLAKRYLPTLTALDKEYAGKDVQFVGVNSAEEDSIISMATQAVQHDVAFPFVKDFGGVCARVLGVRRTPEAVILDADKRLRYRGRIDDQYRLGGVPRKRRAAICKWLSMRCSRGRMSPHPRRRWTAARSRLPRNASRAR